MADPSSLALDRRYRAWRVRVLYATFIGYALFYFCRKNLPLAMGALGAELHYSNSQLGLLGSLLYVSYGVGKFVNGVAGDHVNPRWFMALGLLASALCNALFGGSSALFALAVLWAFNGWFQSMGFPPCARLLSHWFSVSERGSAWGLWNLSHQVGGALIALWAALLVEQHGWRAAFFAPAALCALGALFLWDRLRDTPASLGLPPVAVYRGDPELDRDGQVLSDEPESVREVLFRRVLNNPAVWAVSVMNLFIYVVRTGVFDWSAKFLMEHKQLPLRQASYGASAFELAGVAGSLLAGVLSDRLFAGRRGPMCLAFLLLSFVSVALLYALPPRSPYLAVAALGLCGFAIYGPQFLVGVFVTDLASPKASATAVGLTGVWGYAGSALAGVGTGWLVDRHGWGGGFAFWAACCLVGAVIAAPLWRLGARRPGGA